MSVSSLSTICLAAVFLVLLGNTTRTAAQVFDLHYPVIHEVFPSFGSTEGGTRLSIRGANFQPSGLFTNRAIFIGGERCAEITYYTSDTLLTCITPACVTSECRSSIDYSGVSTVSLTVFVQDVSTTLQASSTFQYIGRSGDVGKVTKMSQVGWGTSTMYTRGVIANPFLEDLNIFLGSNRAYIGEAQELNAEEFQGSSGILFYRPADDLLAGFYNYSMYWTDIRERRENTGLARMYPERFPPSLVVDRSYSYHFTAAVSNAVYTSVVLPVVTNIYPQAGSLAGGTVVTISGHGFSRDLEKMTVYVSGQLCDVFSSEEDQVQCTTRPALPRTAILALVTKTPPAVAPGASNGEFQQVLPTIDPFVQANSTRVGGSAGWWGRVWSGNSPNAGSVGDVTATDMSFGFRDRMRHSFTLLFNRAVDWNKFLPIVPVGEFFDQSYTLELRSILVAPYSGYYNVLVQLRETVSVYGKKVKSVDAPGAYASYRSKEDALFGELSGAAFGGTVWNETTQSAEEEAETLLLSATCCSENSYFTDDQQQSTRFYLKRGDRYQLRVVFVNIAGNDQDFLQMALRIQPDARNTSGDPTALSGVQYLADFNDSLSSKVANGSPYVPEMTELPEFHTPTALQHIGVRDLQLVSLNYEFFYERQVITFHGVTGGSFRVIMQNGATVTTDINLSDGEAVIESAMRTAATLLPASQRECDLFEGDIQRISSVGFVQITIEWRCEYSGNATLISLFDVSLEGDYTVDIRRTQRRSVPPSGTFDLLYYGPTPSHPEGDRESRQPTGTLTLPFDATVSAVESAFDSIGAEVSVVATGGRDIGFKYQINFLSPAGNLPLLGLNTTDLVVEQLTAETRKLTNGGGEGLIFDPIPSYMLEVPYEWATASAVGGGFVTGGIPEEVKRSFPGGERGCVEVYVESDSGVKLKAVLDSTGNFAPANKTSFLADGRLSVFKGYEEAGAFVYSSNATAVVSNYTLNRPAGSNAGTTEVVVWGNYFLMGGEGSEVTVTIAGSVCDILSKTSTEIRCLVSSVPWGEHIPVVNLTGYGLAFIAANVSENKLRFRQEIYGFSPSVSSVAGGRIITIHGRGFRESAEVLLKNTATGEIPDRCRVLTANSTQISCRLPAAPTLATKLPTTFPTASPTAPPSADPTAVPSASPSLSPSAEPTAMPTVPPSTVPSAAPTTSSPTPTPTADPTEAPSAVPSAPPSASPTVLSDAPTTEPTEEPSNEPSEEPSFSPTPHPSASPTVSTAAPYAAPSAEPSAPQAALPFALPSTAPTPVSTVVPSAEPTDKPSAEPSEEPSPSHTPPPSVSPTVASSAALSTIPTAEPTEEPSVEPSEEPSEEPSAVPSTGRRRSLLLQPSREVDGERLTGRGLFAAKDTLGADPTAAPSSVDTNSYIFSIDGFDADAQVTGVFDYDLAATPLVSSISPDMLSSAITFNVSIFGSGLLPFGMEETSAGGAFGVVTNSSVTVTIGEETCSQVTIFTSGNFTVEQMLTCVLARTNSPGALNTSVVSVFVPGKGFAGRAENPLELPTVQRGYEIRSVFPRAGSVLGGNTLTIDGFGFLDGAPHRHSVTLTQVGLPPASEYDALLVAIGLPPESNQADDAILTCEPVSVTLTTLVCHLPEHLSDVYPDAEYSVVVKINNMAAICTDPFADVDSGGSDLGCMYVQDAAFTPELSNIDPAILTEDPDTGNPTSVQVHLSNLIVQESDLQDGVGLWNRDILLLRLVDITGSEADIYLSKVSPNCSMHSEGVCSAGDVLYDPTVDNATVVFFPPLLSGGIWSIFALIEDRGYTQSAAQLVINTTITQYEFVGGATNGSMAGGSLLLVSGKGFSSQCRELSLTYSLLLTNTDGVLDGITESGLTSSGISDVIEVAVQSSDAFDECRPNLLKLRTPSIINAVFGNHQHNHAIEDDDTFPANNNMDGVVTNLQPSLSALLRDNPADFGAVLLGFTVERKALHPTSAALVGISPSAPSSFSLTSTAQPQASPTLSPATSPSQIPDRIYDVSGLFSFTVANTPIVQLSTDAGVAGDELFLTIYSRISFLNVSSIKVTVGGNECQDLFLLDAIAAANQTASMADFLAMTGVVVGAGMYDLSFGCRVPHLAATIGESPAYNVIVDIQPLGYAVNATSVYTVLPTFYSQLEVNELFTVINKDDGSIVAPASSHFNASVEGGLQITVTGNGFSAEDGRGGGEGEETVYVSLLCDGEDPTATFRETILPQPPSSACTLATASDGSSLTTYNSYSCLLPERRTVRAIEEVLADATTAALAAGSSSAPTAANALEDFVRVLPGTMISSRPEVDSLLPYEATDDNVETGFVHRTDGCFLGLKLPAGFMAIPMRMRFFPTVGLDSDVADFVFEGSSDSGATYTTFAREAGANSAWNVVDVEDEETAFSGAGGKWFNAFRFRETKPGQSENFCQLAEIRFLGVLAHASDTCDVVVSGEITVGSVTYPGIRTFSPVITAVSPNNGTALGGDIVRLSGYNLSPVNDSRWIENIASGIVPEQKLSVQLSGIDCAIISHSDYEIECVTGRRLPEDATKSKIEVVVPTRGLAFVPKNVRFLYIDKWSALTSWLNQEPPVDRDLVWIPEGQVILLDVDSPLLEFLYVQGDLYFDRTRVHTKLDAFYFFIEGGYVEIGTEEEPFENKVEITLHGDRFAQVEIPHMGAKMIVVSSKGALTQTAGVGAMVGDVDKGQWEVHGAKRLRTWTKLNRTVLLNDTSFYTAEPVDFLPGDRVVLAGSNENRGGQGFEEQTVLFTESDGHTVHIDGRFRYDHYSYIAEVEGRTIDMRISVGLLTRNIVIQGDELRSNGQQYGVHTGVLQRGIYRIENAEFRRCGQSFLLGRYCTHSHMTGNMEGSYVKANSIHSSYQRAVTTHDTHRWEVRDNVAYNVRGHAYFVEDGAELHNEFTGNLGIFVRVSSALLLSDLKPAVFWAASITNFWRDNVGSHGNFGFWIELPGFIPSAPGDPYAIVCCDSMPLGGFRNNTFHSNGGEGLRIYPLWTPMQNPCGKNPAFGPEDTDPAYMHDTVFFGNGNNGMFARDHGDIHHVGYKSVFNRGSHLSIVTLHSPYHDDPHIVDSLFVGDIRDRFTMNSRPGVAVHTPQSENFYIANSTFVNFGQAPTFQSCNFCNEPGSTNQGGQTTRFSGLKFVNSANKIRWTERKKEIYWDLDGTLGGAADSMIVFGHGNLLYPECPLLDTVAFDNSVRCGGDGSDVRVRRVSLDSVLPSELSYTDLEVISDAGIGEYGFLPLDTFGWVFPVVTGRGSPKSVRFEFQSSISARVFRLDYSADQYLLETLPDGIRVSAFGTYSELVVVQYTPFPFDYVPYSFMMTYLGETEVAPIAAANFGLRLTQMGDYKFYNQTVDIVLNNVGENVSNALISEVSPYAIRAEAMLCPPDGCPIPPVPGIGDPRFWSNPNSWPSGSIPLEGDVVVIEPNMWIVMDINPPNLGEITIYGKLTFQNNASFPEDFTLRVLSIANFGTFSISDPDGISPFNGNATVILYGGKGASVPLVVREGAFVGSKVIAVAGNFTAIGQPIVRQWTRLNSTVNPGDTVIYLSEYVDWRVGDEVVLSPTAYFDSEGEAWYDEDAPRGSPIEIRSIVSISYVPSPSLPSSSRARTRQLLDQEQDREEIVETTVFTPKTSSFYVNKRDFSTESEDSDPSSQPSTQPSSRPSVEPSNQPTSNPTDYASTRRPFDPATGKGGTFVLVLDAPLNHTHLCEKLHGELFCGAVGSLTRSVRFLSEDSTVAPNEGFGGHVAVVDIPESNLYPDFTAINVEFKNFGKIDGDNNVISLLFSEPNPRPLTVLNCSFNQGYNQALRGTGNSRNLTFENNVAVGNVGGGVTIQSSDLDFRVANNLVLGMTFIESQATSTNLFTRPLAGIYILSAEGVVSGNLVAGSVDQGISVLTEMFYFQENNPVVSAEDLCGVTRAEPYNVSKYQAYVAWQLGEERAGAGTMSERGRGRGFFDNEAVACRGGLQIVAALEEFVGGNKPTCAVASGLKAWRNAHTGVLGLDLMVDLLLGDLVLAENHIGVAISFYRIATNGFSGLVSSKIIGSFSTDNSTCSDLADSAWLRDRQCDVFTGSFPLGGSGRCSSSLASSYKRVGVLMPEWTNKPRTCAASGRFDLCDPPTTPDRLCMLPWDSSYGLPRSLMYTEQHVHDTAFLGFFDAEFPENTTTTGECVPQQYHDASAGIAMRPRQTDLQASLIASGLRWGNSSQKARIGLDFSTRFCSGKNCPGQQHVLMHDLDASLSGNADDEAGQLVFNNPGLIESFPACFEMPEIALSLFFCPSTPVLNNDLDFEEVELTQNLEVLRQYQGIFRTSGPAIIEPMIVTRVLPTSNRTFGIAMPIDDFCAQRMTFSQFPFLIASGREQHIRTTGGIPNEFYLRWDAPRETDVALVHIFITHSQAINVFVSRQPDRGFVHIQKNDTVPTLFDRAGANSRDPQNRRLSVVLRGGDVRFYKFTKIPVASVTIKFDLPLEDFFGDTFVANIALLLGISASRIKIVSVKQGSVVVDFEVSPSVEVANDTEDVERQIDELQTISTNLTSVIISGDLANSTGPIVEVIFEAPVDDVIFDELQDPGVNETFTNVSIVVLKESLVALETPTEQVLLTYPTSMPSTQPSSQPSSEPTQPTSQPSMQPSGQPSSLPTTQPNIFPTGLPSSVPSTQPSMQPSIHPSIQPSAAPSIQPFVRPTSSPTIQPSSSPSAQPDTSPSSQPSIEPSGQPTRSPSGQPSLLPTCQPSARPSAQPSKTPSKQPSNTPSIQPTSPPTCTPTVTPTIQPSMYPTMQPAALPSDQPSTQPSSQPSIVPTVAPTMQPTTQPSSFPSLKPSAQPSLSPTDQPSTVPTFHPTTTPSSQPSSEPSQQPTNTPTSAPSEQPSAQPTCAPTTYPSAQPSRGPSQSPTVLPTLSPTSQPSCMPSIQPTDLPTSQPSLLPTSCPSRQPSSQPSSYPTLSPTASPSAQPTTQPSVQPSNYPSSQPSIEPSGQPTRSPSGQPSVLPTCQPSAQPSIRPSSYPSSMPSHKPSVQPTFQPSSQPTESPTQHPSGPPSAQPTVLPSFQPTDFPTQFPSSQPTTKPSFQPSNRPTQGPSSQPSVSPSQQPISAPSNQPTMQPTTQPTSTPTLNPFSSPSSFPSVQPTNEPTTQPTRQPSMQPTNFPSSYPSAQPSAVPSGHPSCHPSCSPSCVPSGDPSSCPSVQPSTAPSNQPSIAPTTVPSGLPSALPTRQPSCAPSSLPTTQPSTNPSAIPTSKPSLPSAEPTFPPTFRPTLQQQPSFTFESGITLVNITSANLTESDRLAVRTTIANELDVSLGSVVYTGSTIVTTRTSASFFSFSSSVVKNNNDSRDASSLALLQARYANDVGLARDPERDLHKHEERRFLQQGELYTVVANTETQINLVDFPQYSEDSAAAYTAFSGKLQASLASGNFTKRLRAVSAEVGATGTLTASGSSVTLNAPVIVFPPSPSPTFSPTSNEEGIELAGIVIGVAIGAALVGIALYYTYAAFVKTDYKIPSIFVDKKMLDVESTFRELAHDDKLSGAHFLAAGRGASLVELNPNLILSSGRVAQNEDDENVATRVKEIGESAVFELRMGVETLDPLSRLFSSQNNNSNNDINDMQGSKSLGSGRMGRRNSSTRRRVEIDGPPERAIVRSACHGKKVHFNKEQEEEERKDLEVDQQGVDLDQVVLSTAVTAAAIASPANEQTDIYNDDQHSDYSDLPLSDISTAALAQLTVKIGPLQTKINLGLDSAAELTVSSICEITESVFSILKSEFGDRLDYSPRRYATLLTEEFVVSLFRKVSSLCTNADALDEFSASSLAKLVTLSSAHVMQSMEVSESSMQAFQGLCRFGATIDTQNIENIDLLVAAGVWKVIACALSTHGSRSAHLAECGLTALGSMCNSATHTLEFCAILPTGGNANDIAMSMLKEHGRDHPTTVARAAFFALGNMNIKSTTGVVVVDQEMSALCAQILSTHGGVSASASAAASDDLLVMYGAFFLASLTGSSQNNNSINNINKNSEINTHNFAAAGVPGILVDLLRIHTEIAAIGAVKFLLLAVSKFNINDPHISAQFSAHNVCEAVVLSIQMLAQTHPAALSFGIACISELCRRSDSPQIVEFNDMGTFDLLTEIVSDPSLQESVSASVAETTLGALCNLSVSFHQFSSVKFGIPSTKACALITSLLLAHGDENQVTAKNGLGAVCNLSNENPHNKAEFGRVGACPVVVRMLALHGSTSFEIARDGLAAIAKLADNQERDNVQRLQQVNAGVICANVMERYVLRNNRSVALEGMLAVFNLSRESDQAKAIVRDTAICDIVLHSIARYSGIVSDQNREASSSSSSSSRALFDVRIIQRGVELLWHFLSFQRERIRDTLLALNAEEVLYEHVCSNPLVTDEETKQEAGLIVRELSDSFGGKEKEEGLPTVNSFPPAPMLGFLRRGRR